MLPYTAPEPARANRPWQGQRKLPPATETRSCSSCPINPKISRQTAAKALVSQLDARIGPKAAVTISTVPTVGDWRWEAKLQKEHALGHSCKAFCLCGLWLWCGLCLRGRRRLPREGPEVKIKSRGRGRPQSHEPRKLGFAIAMKPKSSNLIRCTWPSNPLCIRYHDEEWGLPQHDDRALFEFLILEGAQAGLSWDTILQKRENYRAAFDSFDPNKIARYNLRKVQRLLGDQGIVRNRLKIASAVRNAKAFLIVQKEFGSFDRYIWQFVNKARANARRSTQLIPARTAESDAMSKDLKKRGFNFVGSTICYAFMQAVGMVNDHSIECFRYAQINRARRPRA